MPGATAANDGGLLARLRQRLQVGDRPAILPWNRPDHRDQLDVVVHDEQSKNSQTEERHVAKRNPKPPFPWLAACGALGGAALLGLIAVGVYRVRHAQA